MSLRFDWYPNYQHEVIISQSDLIADRLITKGMAHKDQRGPQADNTENPKCTLLRLYISTKGYHFSLNFTHFRSLFGNTLFVPSGSKDL